MADARPDVALQRKLRPLRRSPAVGDPEAAGAGAGGSSSSSTSSKKTKGPAARAGKPSFSSVLALCDPVDTLLLFVGCVGAAANGAALPLFSLAFGSMVDVLGPAATVGALRSEVERVAGYFLILAAGKNRWSKERKG
jgi:ATP-binding cassette subfamily B (MDR/TAP) protein 1